MFLSGKIPKVPKGIKSLTMSLSHPPNFEPSNPILKPKSNIPTRGETEMTREDRHNRYLRNQRMMKREKKRNDQTRRALAKNDKKLQSKIDKEDAIKSLSKNRNVKIIKKTSKSFKENKK